MPVMNACPPEIEISEQGHLRLSPELRLRIGVPSLDLSHEPGAHGSKVMPEIVTRTDGTTLITKPGEYRIEQRLVERGEGWLALETRVSNLSDTPLPLENVVALRVTEIEGHLPFDRIFTQGRDMCGFSQLEPLAGARDSDSVAGFASAEGPLALVIGFESFSEAFGQLHLEQAQDALACEARWQREGIALQPGAELQCAPLLIGHGQGMNALLRDYANYVGRAMGVRTSRQVMTGWCSWYYYYGTETQADILRDVDALAESPFADGLRVIQIDDGWNKPTAEHPRVWGDWQAGAKFPQGMRAIADQIHARGFEAGLWLAPFSVDKASQLYEMHPEWLVGGELSNTGLVEPADCFGVAALDLTHPGAQQFLRETFERVFDEWGFDYIKIDFLLHALVKGARYDNSKTSAEVYRIGLSIIRSVAKDRFVLTCGAPFGPSIGLTDAMRIGMDVSSRWYLPFNLGSWPLGNCAILPGARQVALRQWMNGIWWQNDPDCVLVRDYGSPGELHEFANLNGGEFLHSPPYGLSEEEAGFWLRLTWLTGGMLMLGECVQHLKGQHLEWLRNIFPPLEQPAQRVDWQIDPQLLAFRSDARGGLLGLFNFSDEARVPTLPAELMGGPGPGPWRMTEWLTGETVEVIGPLVVFPALPAHGGQIWQWNQL